MQRWLAIILTLCISSSSWTQWKDSTSVYDIRWKRDACIAAGGFALLFTGQMFAFAKPVPTIEQLNALDPMDVNAFDRPATEQWHENATTAADVLLIGSIALPSLLLADAHIRKDGWKLGFLYLENFLYTTGIFSMCAGPVRRLRPYAYNPEASLKLKLRDDLWNSFYAGHPAVGGAALFFGAQVFADYHPTAPWIYKALMYAFASGMTGVLGYLRYKGGRHFMSDIIVGIAMAPVTGVTIPILYRNKHRMAGFTFAPMGGPVNGLSMRYNFQERRKEPKAILPVQVTTPLPEAYLPARMGSWRTPIVQE